MYKMFYREVKMPDNYGEARSVPNKKEAQAICEKHNLMYPKYHHWFEKNDSYDPEKNGSSNTY